MNLSQVHQHQCLYSLYILLLLLLLSHQFVAVSSKSTGGGKIRQNEFADADADGDAKEGEADDEDVAASPRARDAGEISCDVTVEPGIFRNGLGDNSVFIWPDNTIPFKIGTGFDAEKTHNIYEAVDEYNRAFEGCITWVERTDEVI